MKTTISFRVKQAQSDALSEIADSFGVGKSELLRGQVRQLIDEHENICDDYMVLANIIEKEQAKANPFQKVSHMPNNLFNFCIEQIDEPYPMPVEDIVDERYKPYKKAIEKKFDDNEERKNSMLMKLHHTLRTYEILHPTSEEAPKEVANACVTFAISIREKEDMETAREWVSERVKDGTLSDEYRDDVFDKLREKQREEWQTEWKENTVRANW